MNNKTKMLGTEVTINEMYSFLKIVSAYRKECDLEEVNPELDTLEAIVQRTYNILAPIAYNEAVDIVKRELDKMQMLDNLKTRMKM